MQTITENFFEFSFMDSFDGDFGSPLQKDHSSDELSLDNFTMNWSQFHENSFDFEDPSNDEILTHDSPTVSPIKKDKHVEDVLEVFEGLLQAGLITREEYNERKNELENIEISSQISSVELFALEVEEEEEEEEYSVRLRKRKNKNLDKSPKEKKQKANNHQKLDKNSEQHKLLKEPKVVKEPKVPKETKRAKLAELPPQIKERLERDEAQKDIMVAENKQIHESFEEKRVFWRAFHQLRKVKPMGTYPYIASRPIDLHKLYLEVTKRGGYERISTKHGIPVEWSKKWEHIFKVIVKHKGPQYDPKSGDSLPLGDVRGRRQKLKNFYEEFLLEFERSNTIQTEVVGKYLGQYVRCACGHSHHEVPRGGCVTCDSYLETRWNICTTDLVQCEACGAWQHIQCLLEESLLRPLEVKLLEQNEDFHYYCEMCRCKEFSHPWTSKVLTRELPIDWTVERRFRIGKRPDYYSFKPGNQLFGRFCKRSVLRSFIQLDEAIAKEEEDKRNI